MCSWQCLISTKQFTTTKNAKANLLIHSHQIKSMFIYNENRNCLHLNDWEINNNLRNSFVIIIFRWNFLCVRVSYLLLVQILWLFLSLHYILNIDNFIRTQCFLLCHTRCLCRRAYFWLRYSLLSPPEFLLVNPIPGCGYHFRRTDFFFFVSLLGWSWSRWRFILVFNWR